LDVTHTKVYSVEDVSFRVILREVWLSSPSTQNFRNIHNEEKRTIYPTRMFPSSNTDTLPCATVTLRTKGNTSSAKVAFIDCWSILRMSPRAVPFGGMEKSEASLSNRLNRRMTMRPYFTAKEENCASIEYYRC
jgi:hypothetical protein